MLNVLSSGSPLFFWRGQCFELTLCGARFDVMYEIYEFCHGLSSLINQKIHYCTFEDDKAFIDQCVKRAFGDLG